MIIKDKRYNEVKLKFKEDEHKYTDTLGNEYVSTTTFLHRYVPVFDKSYWLRKKAKELNISEKRLEQQWDTIKDEACREGTNYHNGLENGIKGASMFVDAVQYKLKPNGEMVTVADIPNINENVKPLDVKEFIDFTENKYPQIYEVFNYYTERGYKIYSEMGAFLLDYLISGCIDVLCLRDDQFVLGDWKTNRGGLKFESGYFKKDKSQRPYQETDNWVTTSETLLAPLSHLPNCNGFVYNMQTSLYALYVEYILGIPCAGIWLCHIDRDFVLNEYGRPKRFSDGLYHIKNVPNSTTTFYKMNYLREDCIKILMDRRKEVEATKILGDKLF